MIVALLGATFASLSYSVALITKSEDALAPLLNGIAMPLLLLSGILLPMQIGPTWLQRLSDISPLKHVVNGVRALFRGDIGSSASLWGLFWVVLLTVDRPGRRRPHLPQGIRLTAVRSSVRYAEFIGALLPALSVAGVRCLRRWSVGSVGSCLVAVGSLVTSVVPDSSWVASLPMTGELRATWPGG